MKIFIDPGHGGDSVGATYKGRKEQDDVLKLSLAIRDLLVEQGVDVKMSRETSVNPLISERAEAANKWGADYFISVHRNAYKPEAANGAEVWCYSKIEKGGETYNKAKRINDLLCDETGFANRGIKLGAPAYKDYGVNSLTNMSSCLLEVGFIDNSKDNAIFDGKFDAIAESIAKGLLEAVGGVWKKTVIKGDVDGDGKVTTADARAILRTAVGLEDAPLESADMDGDGKVTVADARDAMRKSIGL